jgi:rubrerythrin
MLNGLKQILTTGAANSGRSKMDDLECLLCGAQFEADDPDECPNCGGPPDDLIPIEQARENARINAQEEYNED